MFYFKKSIYFSAALVEHSFKLSNLKFKFMYSVQSQMSYTLMD